jgi:uncharacterized heparinase superfamily protein
MLSGHGQIAEFIKEHSQQEKVFNNAAAILAGRFTFNHETRTMEPVAWHDPEQSLLWNLNLHYFEYTLDLGLAYRLSAGENKRYYMKFKNLVLDWLSANRTGIGNGWNGYAVSVRTGIWMVLYEIFETELAADHSFRELFLSQIIKQVLFIAHNLEFDVRGNHLLKNLKALRLAGQFFTGGLSRKWVTKAEKLLLAEINRQILPDGGHFERSTMYHCQILQDLLEIYLVAALESNDLSPFQNVLLDTLIKMSHFLFNQLHSDGTMALFGDSALGLAANPLDLITATANLAVCTFENIDYSLNDAYLFLVGGNRLITKMNHTRDHTAALFTRPETISFNDSGYFTIRNGNKDFLLADGGNFGPDSLPAHSHCDMLSYELSLGGERIIIDSGILEYAPDKWRQYFRSTSAHNTVMVDDIEQAHCWGSFRVGSRARRVSASLETDRNGYPVFKGVIDLTPTASFQLFHQREIRYIDKSLWLVVDLIHSGGSITHSLKSFIHFEKGLSTTIDQNRIFVYKNSILKAQIMPLNVDDIQILRGEESIPQGYCAERFGQLEENDVAVLIKSMNSLQVYFGYVICPPDVPDPQMGISGESLMINGLKM